MAKLGSMEGGGASRGGGRVEEEFLEVRPPAGSGGKVLRLRVLDGVSLRVRSTRFPASYDNVECYGTDEL